MAEEEKLKLGKGAAFVKSRLKALPQGDETWEADFQALPKPIDADRDPLPRHGRHGGGGLAPGRHRRSTAGPRSTTWPRSWPTPCGDRSDGDARRPRLVRLRGHHQWRGLFPHLEEIGVGVEVLVGQSLPGIERAYEAHLRRLRDEHRVGMIEPSAEQLKAGAMFPAIDRWVKEYGWIEIGVQELFGFVARALHEGGIQVEDERADTLAEAMAALEVGLVRWFREQGVDID